MFLQTVYSEEQKKSSNDEPKKEEKGFFDKLGDKVESYYDKVVDVVKDSYETVKSKTWGSNSDKQGSAEDKLKLDKQV